MQPEYRERAPELCLDLGELDALTCMVPGQSISWWPTCLPTRLPSLGRQERWRGTFSAQASNLLSEILEPEDEKCLGGPECILVRQVNKGNTVKWKVSQLQTADL